MRGEIKKSRLFVLLAVFLSAGAGICLYAWQERLFFSEYGRFAPGAGIPPLIAPQVRFLADGLNRHGFKNYLPSCRHIAIYAANWTEDEKLPELSAQERACAIIWLGSRQNAMPKGLEGFGKIWVSSPLLQSFLEIFHPAYVPLFALPASQQRVAAKDDDGADEKFYAVIGCLPYIEKLLQQNNLPYRKYDLRTGTDALQHDIAHLKAVFAETGALDTQTLDVHPFFLQALQNKIPLATLWIWPKEDPLNRFNDLINFYQDENGAERLLKAIENEDAAVRQRTEKAARLIEREYSPQRALRVAIDSLSPAPLAAYAGFPYAAAEKGSLMIDLPTAIGHYIAGDYALASDLAAYLKPDGKTADLAFYNSLFKYPAETAIILRGFVPLIYDNIKADKRILYLAYPQFGETNDKEDIPDIDAYADILARESARFDAVAVSSPVLADGLRERGIAVFYIPQFTNTARFYPDFDEDLQSNVLFVGINTFYRTAVYDLLQRGIAVDVYGPGWPEGIAKAPYADNRILRKYYSSAKIVLNDTRDGMKKFGVVSNRIFDATACGTLVISDYMPEIAAIYGDSVPMYKNGDELAALVRHYLSHEDERREKAARAREITLKHFTAEKAAETFEKIIKDIHAPADGE